MREEKLEKQIFEALKRISITQEHRQWITTALVESFRDEQTYTKERINSLQAQKAKLRERIDTIYLDKLDGKITEEFWLENIINGHKTL